MQIVAVQLNSVWENKPASHQKVRELLANESIDENSLIVFPEMFDTGFSMDPSATGPSAGDSESFLRETAANYRSTVMAGIVTVVSPTEGGRFKNEAVAMAPDGSDLVRYRKMQPFTLTGEDKHYGAGDRHQLFDWSGMKVAPFICYDLRFPEVFRPAARDGAELFVVMACWPKKRSEHWVRLLQARAIENQAYVVGVNRCGSEPKFEYDGRSCAFDPHGVSMFEADATEQVFHVDVDPTVVRDWREEFPALRDMRS
ncbi:nitrilase-related carbon-nitrogen hydrolase [Planctomycetota bacterium]